MNSGPKTLLVLVLLVAAAAAGFLLFGGGADTPGPLPDGTPEVVDTPDVEPPPEQQVDPTPVRTATEPPTRTAIPEAHIPSGEDFEQGVTGVVVAPNGTPAAGVDVFLFEGHGANIFAAMLQQASGIQPGPLARTATDDSGGFRVGVKTIEPGKTYELRFTSDRYADLTKPQITLFEGKWWDAGRIQLQSGATVQGRVTELARGGAPIAGASVFAKPATSGFIFAATPGRENGIEVQTDPNGYYRFDNIPAGVVNLAAVAPGCARVEHTNVTVRENEPMTFDFELPPGMEIIGVVTDEKGSPIESAKVTVTAISSKTRLSLDERTDADGRFHAIGLLDGPYQVTAVAPGFVQKDVKPWFAGATNEPPIVLERQGSVRLFVVAKSGQRVRRYDAVLKNWFGEQSTYGNLPGVPVQKVHPRDLASDGSYTFGGLNPGNYALEIHAQGFAKAFSEPFTITAGGTQPEVSVELSEGGRIVGQVIGEEGQPVAGVTISTMPNDLQDNALLDMFGPMIPYNITRTGGRTNAAGRFDLPLLIPGTYQLKIEHPDHYVVYQKDIEVVEGAPTELQPLRISRGTRVFGTARVDGVPTAQLRINVSSTPDPNGGQTNTFQAQAVTDDQGRFELPKRLPPGHYQASAGRQDNPFHMVIDYSKTKQEFTVTPGLREHELHFDILSQ